MSTLEFFQALTFPAPVHPWRCVTGVSGISTVPPAVSFHLGEVTDHSIAVEIYLWTGCPFSLRHVVLYILGHFLSPYLILQNLVVSDEGEHLHREMLVLGRKLNFGVAHRKECGGVAIILVLAARRHFRTLVLGNCSHQNLADTQPINNDVPAGCGCAIFM